MTDSDRPEIGALVDAGGIKTNYLEAGEGPPVVLVHGSGPGVTAYANWRLTIPDLARHFRVLAPDMAGFGFTEKPEGATYGMPLWVDQIVGFLDALDLPRVSLVGNSFGGGLAISLAVKHPQRVERMVLMGAMGVVFPITEGLDFVWGYEPSIENMRRSLDYFAYSRELVTDELAEVRYRAALEPGPGGVLGHVPRPPPALGGGHGHPRGRIAAIPHETLIVHGRDDQVIPIENAYRLLHLIEKSELHVFGRCGHWSQIEWADDFNALLVRFLGREPQIARQESAPWL